LTMTKSVSLNRQICKSCYLNDMSIHGFHFGRCLVCKKTAELTVIDIIGDFEKLTEKAFFSLFQIRELSENLILINTMLNAIAKSC
jgi:hypothetical protein